MPSVTSRMAKKQEALPVHRIPIACGNIAQLASTNVEKISIRNKDCFSRICSFFHEDFFTAYCLLPPVLLSYTCEISPEVETCTTKETKRR